MMTLSIGKTIAPALLVGTASVAAIVYAVTQVPHGERLGSAPVGVMSQPSQPESGASNAKRAAVSSDTGGSKSEANSASSSAQTSEAPTALAAAESKVAALSADLGTPPSAPPSAPAANPSVPSFDLARIETGGDAVIAGRAAPGATVDLMRDGERLDRVVADASGQFVMVPPRLPAGSYELTLSAKLADGTVALSKQGVTVTVKEADAATGSITPHAEAAAQPAAPVAKQQDTAAPPRHAMMAATASDDGASAPKSGSASGTTRVVTRGDSLWRISRITYGAGQQYAVLYRANRDRIRDPNLIHPGQVLVLPVNRR